MAIKSRYTSLVPARAPRSDNRLARSCSPSSRNGALEEPSQADLCTRTRSPRRWSTRYGWCLALSTDSSVLCHSHSWYCPPIPLSSVHRSHSWLCPPIPRYLRSAKVLWWPATSCSMFREDLHAQTAHRSFEASNTRPQRPLERSRRDRPGT